MNPGSRPDTDPRVRRLNADPGRELNAAPRRAASTHHSTRNALMRLGIKRPLPWSDSVGDCCSGRGEELRHRLPHGIGQKVVLSFAQGKNVRDGRGEEHDVQENSQGGAERPVQDRDA